MVKFPTSLGDRAYKKSSMSTSRNFYRCRPQLMIGVRNANQRCVQFFFQGKFFYTVFWFWFIDNYHFNALRLAAVTFFSQETINFIGLKVKNLSSPYRHLSPLSQRQGTISLKEPAAKSRTACPQTSELIRSIVHWREIQGESWKREHGSFLSIIHMVCLRWRRLLVS